MFDKLHSQKKKKKNFDKLRIMNELRLKHRFVWRLLNKLKGVWVQMHWVEVVYLKIGGT